MVTKGREEGGDSEVGTVGALIRQTVTLSNAIYEACLRYTILALMAPIWNQAGEYMVQGHDEMFIAVWPLRVRMRPLEFSDLDIVPSTKEEFFSKREGCISELSLGAQQLHVLPSLKKGRIVSISRKIPSSCPYQSYKELKRHWKNLYGYRLPESDETILYFTMHFNAFSSTVYTYPSLCVRPDGIQFHSRVNFKESSEIPSFHGSPKLNLKRVTRFDGSILESTIFSDFEYPFDSEINTLTQKTSLCKDVSACSQKLSLMTPTCNTSEQACTPKQEFLGRHFTDNKRKAHHSLGDSPPLFLPYAIPPRSQQTTSISKGDKTCKMRPSLSESPPLFLPYSISLKTQPTASTSNGNEMKPLFNSLSTSVGNYSGMSTIQQEIKPIVPFFSKHFKFDVTSDKATSSKSRMSQDASLKTASKVNMVKLSTIVKEFQLKREIEPVTKLDEGPFPKKSRSRPRVQPDMDVEALARANDLGKVNTATLVKWLRENKVSCKVKDKKSDLVNKVMAYLNISSNL
ncbi:unnamed protein product [Timema podura]|uniref:DUF4708 domain-containing protein n=1 Tax=Timema podura TaxID=61482 RepID=A0ABN7NKT5_TIMPD|nr:unnamed protein product [Timema podura]